MKTVQVKCVECGATIDYDGVMTWCPVCKMEFESSEISAWKKLLAESKTPPVKQSNADVAENGAKESDIHIAEQADSGKVFAVSENAAGQNEAFDAFEFIPMDIPLTPVSSPVSGKPRQTEAETYNSVNDEPIFVWRGKRYYVEDARDACLFLLKQGLIDEAVDADGCPTPTARALLAAMGKTMPDLSARGRIEKFFEIMYGGAFDGEQLPLYVTDPRIDAPMARDRTRLLYALEKNGYADVTFDVCGEKANLSKLAELGVLSSYLRLADNSRQSLARVFDNAGKRISIDEEYRCIDLGGDADIYKRDGKMSLRYEYYKSNPSFPAENGYTDKPLDPMFVRAYGGYASGANVNRYFDEYFYLLSVGAHRNGEVEVFGLALSRGNLTSELKRIVEQAAETGDMGKFYLMRQIIGRNVLGAFSDTLVKVVGDSDARHALFNAYYCSERKGKKLLYADGRFNSAERIARQASSRGAVGDLLDGSGGTSFMDSVNKYVKVNANDVRDEIKRGVKSLLEGLK